MLTSAKSNKTRNVCKKGCSSNEETLAVSLKVDENYTIIVHAHQKSDFNSKLLCLTYLLPQNN